MDGNELVPRDAPSRPVAASQPSLASNAGTAQAQSPAAVTVAKHKGGDEASHPDVSPAETPRGEEPGKAVYGDDDGAQDDNPWRE